MRQTGKGCMKWHRLHENWNDSSPLSLASRSLWAVYSTQIMSLSLQWMWVLRQCTVPRAEVVFVTIQRENIHPSKKEMNKADTMLKLPDVCSHVMNHYVSLSPTNRKSAVNLHALNFPHTALKTFTPRRDQLVMCGQYVSETAHFLESTASPHSSI
jgi:hypothetical protein